MVKLTLIYQFSINCIENTTNDALKTNHELVPNNSVIIQATSSRGPSLYYDLFIFVWWQQSLEVNLW